MGCADLTVTQDLVAKLKDGFLARSGLLPEDGLAACADVIARVGAGEVETVRVLFADQHGVLRGKTIVADAIAAAFTSGISLPSSLLLKDTSHRTVFPVWSEDAGIGSGLMQGAGDMVMVPDPTTLRTLPWSPHSAWLFCDVAFKDGTPIPFAPRTVLKRSVDALAGKSLALTLGLEVEFHVFEVVDDRLQHADAGMPGLPPATQLLSQGYQLLTENIYAKLETIVDDLRRSAQALGLPIRSTEIEMGPSQIEFVFDPADPVTHADNMMMFRAMAKQVCAQQGLHATFMCRPTVANCASSGWHLHQSLVDAQSGANLFVPDTMGALTPQASAWIAGLLHHANESCLLTTPTVNGYKRYQPYQLAPDRIQWGRDNRGAMIRGLMTPGDAASRIENRVADTTANPYYFFASQILGGLSGIENALQAPPPVETPYESDAERLPVTLLDAIIAFEAGTLFKTGLGDEFVAYMSGLKRAEWQRYVSALSEWEQREYFSLY